MKVTTAPPGLSLALLVALAASAAPSAARAQSLDELLAAGRRDGLAVAEVRAVADQAAAQAELARAPLWPVLSASAGYTRNQHASVVPLATGSLTIVPLDQLDASASVTVPLLDVGARRRAAASAADAAVARAAIEVTARDGDRAIVAAYYGWIGGTAAVAAARAAELAARDNARIVAERAAAALASPLDVARADAAVADATSTIAAAERVAADARRQLTTLTGRALDAVAPALADDVAAEAPLESWLGATTSQPEVAAARARITAADARLDASRAGYLPTVAATLSERWTNAPGFGAATSATLGVALRWQLDASTGRQVRLDRATARVEAARAAQATAAARDRIIDAWNRVAADRAAAAAAQVRVEATRVGVATARDRFAAGIGTQLDVTLAQRDALAAEVAAIQARADLAAGRALLRLAAGRPVAP
ncbi:MAG: TolC family protein [Kofleriaceae bacterium]